MMKFLHKASLSVFVKREDDAERIRKTFFSLLPFEVHKEKVSFTSEIVEGLEEKKITIFKVDLQKEKHTTAFVKHLQERLFF